MNLLSESDSFSGETTSFKIGIGIMKGTIKNKKRKIPKIMLRIFIFFLALV